MWPSSDVTAETLRDGDPAEREAVHLSSGDEKFTVGSWRAQPYAEFIEAYPGDEYTRVLEGSVTLTGDDGVRTPGPGDLSPDQGMARRIPRHRTAAQTVRHLRRLRAS